MPICNSGIKPVEDCRDYHPTSCSKSKVVPRSEFCLQHKSSLVESSAKNQSRPSQRNHTSKDLHAQIRSTRVLNNGTRNRIGSQATDRGKEENNASPISDFLQRRDGND